MDRWTLYYAGFNRFLSDKNWWNGNYVIASSGPPKRRTLERRTLARIDTLKESNKGLEISDIESVKGSALEASAKLNKDLNDYKIKFSTEEAALKKEQKEEVKALKTSICQANKEKINMKKQALAGSATLGDTS